MYTLYLIMDKIRGNTITRHFFSDYPNYTIKFVISKDFPAKNAFPDFSVIICDRDEGISAAVKTGLPVIAFSHNENPNESLLGTPWLILDADALTPDFLEEVYCRHYGLPLTICETDRCIMRELTASELAPLLVLQKENAGNPAGCFFPENCPDTKQFLESYIKNRYPFYGYGIYGIFAENTGEFMGIAGFSESSAGGRDSQCSQGGQGCSQDSQSDSRDSQCGQDSQNRQNSSQSGQDGCMDVGYSLLKKWQGQKVASEVLPALLAYGRDHYSFAKFTARIRRENRASIRLAEKNGLEILLED